MTDTIRCLCAKCQAFTEHTIPGGKCTVCDAALPTAAEIGDHELSKKLAGLSVAFPANRATRHVCPECDHDKFKRIGDGLECSTCGTYFNPPARGKSPGTKAEIDIPTHAEPWIADGYWIIDQNQRQVAGVKIIERLYEQQKALHLVLAFNRSGAWTPADRALWTSIAGRDESTVRVLCEHIRTVLGLAAEEEA